MGGLFQLFWEKGQGFPGIGPLPTFWPFTVSLGTVMAPLCVCGGGTLSYANILQRVHNEARGLPEVESSTILGLIGSNQFSLYPQWLCHPFKGCALPASLLFHFEGSVYLASLCMGHANLCLVTPGACGCATLGCLQPFPPSGPPGVLRCSEALLPQGLPPWVSLVP